MSNVYKNKHFTKRDYECTNIVAAVAESNPNEANYVLSDEKALDGLMQLHAQNGVQYWGHL